MNPFKSSLLFFLVHSGWFFAPWIVGLEPMRRRSERGSNCHKKFKMNCLRRCIAARGRMRFFVVLVPEDPGFSTAFSHRSIQCIENEAPLLKLFPLYKSPKRPISGRWSHPRPSISPCLTILNLFKDRNKGIPVTSQPILYIVGAVLGVVLEFWSLLLAQRVK